MKEINKPELHTELPAGKPSPAELRAELDRVEARGKQLDDLRSPLIETKESEKGKLPPDSQERQAKLKRLEEGLKNVAFPPRTTPEKFKYKHDPVENPKVLKDAIPDEGAVYGFRPDPNSPRIGRYATKIDWTNSEQVAAAKQEREKYHSDNEMFYSAFQKMAAEGFSKEEIANVVVAQRNQNRMNSYKDDPEGLAIVKQSNLEVYGNESGPTAQDLYMQYGSWDIVIEKSMGSNAGMDACCGLYDKYHYLHDVGKE